LLTKILSSFCIAIEYTADSKLGKLISKLPFVLSLKQNPADTPLYVIPEFEPPPIIIFPSFCILHAKIELDAPVPTLNVGSKLPFVFNLAIRFIFVPLIEVKSPPIIIFPSFWIAIVFIELDAPDPTLKVRFKLPSVFNLAIRFIVVPLIEVKSPPIIIFPSFWIEIVRILVVELALNVGSTLPFVFSLAMQLPDVTIFV